LNHSNSASTKVWGWWTCPATTYGTELDLDGLLRMDAAAQYKTYGDGIQAGLLAPNEGRRKLDLAPLAGGDTAYLQQQNYSLSALSKRDALADPFGVASAAKPPVVVPPAANTNEQAAAKPRRSGAVGQGPCQVDDELIADAIVSGAKAYIDAVVAPLAAADRNP
jgi:hypothetical protein